MSKHLSTGSRPATASSPAGSARTQRVETTRHPGIYRVHARDCTGKRCRCTYQAAVFDSTTGKRIRRNFASERAARIWRADVMNAASKGHVITPAKRTVQQAADELLAGMRDGSIVNRSNRPYKPAAIRSYERALRLRVLPAFGARKLSTVTRGDVQRFAEGLLREGMNASTVRNTLDPLRVILRRAIQLGEIAVDPMAALALPAPQGRRTVALSAKDALALVDALPESEWALWAVALFCGLRRGELRALRWSDVDLTAQPATMAATRTWDDDEGEVGAKTEHGHRIVAMPSFVARLLAAHGLATGRDGVDLVFGATATRPFTPTTIRRRALKAWGDSYLTPHQARHAAASFLISRADVSTLELTRTIGHSDVRTTMNIYGHLLPDSGARVASSLDAMIAAASGQD